jgi:hypothetical protein
VRDIGRYHQLVFGRKPGEPDSVLSDALNHLLYLAKLPADRPLCARVHSPAVSRWLVYVLHMALVEAEYSAAVESVADALGRDPQDLVDLTPIEIPEGVYNLCMSAVESFDYHRGTDPASTNGASAAGTAFATYLRRRAHRYFAELAKRLRAAALQSASTDPSALERRFAGSLEATEAGEGGLGDDARGGDSDVSHIRLRLTRVHVDESMLCPVLTEPDNQTYITSWWAGWLGGRSTRWVQLHARELEAVTAAELYPDETDLLAAGLKAQQYLIPYDEGLAEQAGRSHGVRFSVLCLGGTSFGLDHMAARTKCTATGAAAPSLGARPLQRALESLHVRPQVSAVRPQALVLALRA